MNHKTHRVLITGITGKSGLYMLNEMVAHADELQDYHFKILVRETTNTTKIDKAAEVLSIEKFVGDKKNANDVDKFVQGVYDTLVHLSSIRDSVLLVSTALMYNVSRFILIHTTGIYSKYKAAGEEYREIDAKVKEMCSKTNASITILRPTMIYGTLNDHNMSVFISLVDKYRICPTVNGAKYELQPVWCGDLGKAYYQVLMYPEVTANKDYTLSGGEVIKLIDIFKFIGEQLGVKNTFVSVPYWLAYSGSCVIWAFTLGKNDLREKVQRLVEPRVYDHDEATRDFGYNPLTLREGLISEIEEYKIKKAAGDSMYIEMSSKKDR
jgi:nucleoside-diphosphate-sugar epimerase